MILPEIYRGEDVTLEIILTYEDGTALNLSTLLGYTVEVFQDGKALQKFSKNALAGYDDVVEITPLAGIFEVNIERANTVDAICGKEVYYEVKVEITDTDFPLNLSKKSTGNIAFAMMKESKQRAI